MIFENTMSFAVGGYVLCCWRYVIRYWRICIAILGDAEDHGKRTVPRCWGSFCRGNPWVFPVNLKGSEHIPTLILLVNTVMSHVIGGNTGSFDVPQWVRIFLCPILLGVKRRAFAVVLRYEVTVCPMLLEAKQRSCLVPILDCPMLLEVKQDAFVQTAGNRAVTRHALSHDIGGKMVP